MGDEPRLVGGVAREAATELIVDPARRHGVERGGDHLAGLGCAGAHELATQEVDRHRLRELRRPPEAAPLRIELRAHLLGGGREDVGRRRSAPRRCRPEHLLVDRLGELGGLFLDVVALLVPGLGHDLAHAVKAGMPWRSSLGKYVPP